ncbi:MAG: GTP cyclohydrolase II RibA [Methylobacteriaceae bacterium]|nr:GTP cyclohydrolase II RibA [Methylobacteriaceae bacterium]
MSAERSMIAVERALAEFRAGRPVFVVDGADAALVACAEAIEPPLAALIEDFARGQARLVLPAARLRRLGLERAQAGVVALPTIDVARIATLVLHLDARIDAPVAPAAPLDHAGLELSALALVLPPVVVAPAAGRPAPADVLTVSAADIRDFRAANVRELRLVARAPVPLEGATQTEFVVFRGGEGMRDQVAIVVGRPDVAQPVAVRLHSACLTGDLFGSLKCDCGDQLRSTVRWMAENGGGVLLYLDQEGRGNGIANKMRAYRLQAQGFDTYDADEMLGFENDQRRFDFAAEMLKQLGVSRVRIMTNNPIKMAAMTAAGLEIVEDKRVIGRPTAHNVSYLASKRDRAGHFIDVEALAAQAPIDG